MAVDRHEIANGNDDFLDLLSQFTGGSEDEGLAGFDIGIDLLKDGDGESGSLSGSGLSLCNDIGAYIRGLAFPKMFLDS